MLIQNSVTTELTPQHAGEVIDPNRPAIVIRSELLSPPTRPPEPLTVVTDHGLPPSAEDEPPLASRGRPGGAPMRGVM